MYTFPLSILRCAFNRGVLCFFFRNNGSKSRAVLDTDKFKIARLFDPRAHIPVRVSCDMPLPSSPTSPSSFLLIPPHLSSILHLPTLSPSLPASLLILLPFSFLFPFFRKGTKLLLLCGLPSLTALQKPSLSCGRINYKL